MSNVNQQETSATAPVEGNAKELAYFSVNVGVTFEDENPVAKNPAILDYIAQLKGKDITREAGTTTFPVLASSLAYLLHLTYVNCTDGRVINATFDGIYIFNAPEVEGGEPKQFNAQMITISEIGES